MGCFQYVRLDEIHSRYSRIAYQKFTGWKNTKAPIKSAVLSWCAGFDQL
jgi:hypothetical protein